MKTSNPLLRVPTRVPTVMSDLATLVAATIRDKVVADQQEEIKRLEHQIATLKRQSRTVAITGPNGVPIYARGELDKDGEQVGSVDGYCPRWYVWLTQIPGATIVSHEQLLGLEVRVGDTGKKLMPAGEGIFLDYDRGTRRLDITLFGIPGSLPILHGSLGPLSDSTLSHLQEYGGFGVNQSAEVFEPILEKREGQEQVTILIEAVKFNNDLHTVWDFVEESDGDTAD